MDYVIREYRRGDLPQILAVFNQTITHKNSADYSPEQIAAWVQPEPNFSAWAQRLANGYPLVAVTGRTHAVIGFVNLDVNGVIDLLYVLPDMEAQGVGKALLQQVLQQARTIGLVEVTTAASITARPFFEKFGFVVTHENHVKRQDQLLTNFAMQLKL